MRNRFEKHMPVILLGLLFVITLGITAEATAKKPVSMIMETNTQSLNVTSDKQVDGGMGYGNSADAPGVNIYAAGDYDFSIVLVPMGTKKSAAEEACAAMAGLLGDLTEEKVKVYVMSPLQEEDINQAMEYINQSMADACVFLTENEGETDIYGIQARYNPYFYWEKLPVTELADVFVKSVVIATKNRGIGIKPIEEESYLLQCRIPAIELGIGFSSNEKEAGLLTQPEYRKKIGRGLFDGLKECYKKYHEN